MSKSSKQRRQENRAYIAPNSSGYLQPLSQAGVQVSADTALTYSAIYAAINIIATDIASLPFLTYKRTASGGKQEDPSHPNYDLLYFEPNEEITAFHFEQSMLSHALIFGNGYAEIVRDQDGNTEAIFLLDPRETEPERTELSRKLIYKNNDRYLLPENVIHLAGLGFDGIKGYSPISLARQDIGLGLAGQLYSGSYFGNNAQSSGFLKPVKPLNKEGKQQLKDSFNEAHQGAQNAFKIGVLPYGVDWVQTSLSQKDNEFIATMDFNLLNVCRWYNISPIKLHDYSHATYSNVEQAQIDYVNSTLRPWVENLENEVNRKLFTKAERGTWFARHDLNARMRGDMAARASYYNELFQIGVFSENEIRAQEDLNRLDTPGADKHYVPLNMVATEDTQEPVTQEQDQPLEPVSLAATEQVQDTALNGAQVESLLEIVQSVASGTLPPEAAKGVIAAAFPTLSAEQVDSIINPLQGFEPAQPDANEPVPQQNDSARGAIRDCLIADLSRVARREVKDLRKTLKRDATASLDEFYHKIGSIYREACTPSLVAYRAVLDHYEPNDVGEFFDHLVNDSINALKQAENVEQLLNEWEATKAEKIIAELDMSGGKNEERD